MKVEELINYLEQCKKDMGVILSILDHGVGLAFSSRIASIEITNGHLELIGINNTEDLTIVTTSNA